MLSPGELSATAEKLLLPLCLVLTSHSCVPGSPTTPPRHIVVWFLPPSVVQASPLMVAVSLDPQWSHGGQRPRGSASPAQDTPCTSSEARPRMPQGPQSFSTGGTGPDSAAHTSNSRCQDANPSAPTETCSQGARKTVLVAGDSTGSGAIPTPLVNCGRQHPHRSKCLLKLNC